MPFKTKGIMKLRIRSIVVSKLSVNLNSTSKASHTGSVNDSRDIFIFCNLKLQKFVGR